MALRKQRDGVTCRYCGVLFSPVKLINRPDRYDHPIYFYDLTSKEFCSRECGKASRYKRPARAGIPCHRCGVMFCPVRLDQRDSAFYHHSQGIYCSRECSYPSTGIKRKRSEAPGYECRMCGVIWTPIYYCYGKPKRLAPKAAALALCSPACREKARIQAEPVRIARIARGPRHPSWKGGISGLAKRGRGWRKIAQKVRKLQDYRCADCGESEDSLGHTLDVHHKEPFHNFPNARQANSLSNLIGLCRKCHAQADAKVLHRQSVLGFLIGDQILPGKVRGERNHNSTMTEEQVLEMRRQRAAGASISALCAKFPIGPAGAQAICAGKSWSHVGGPLTSGRKYGGQTGPGLLIRAA